MIETAFTPWASLGGGVLIGAASTLLMLAGIVLAKFSQSTAAGRSAPAT